MNIFKAYDIRGVYPSEINKELAYKIGRAFVKFLNVKNVVVGKDYRIGGKELYEGLTKGINDQGADVWDIGFCSAPSLYFAVNFLKADSGIMITASHNPKEYNGFKFTREKAIPISRDTGLKDIQKIAEDNFKNVKLKGKIIKKDIFKEYIKFVKGFIKDIKPLKIVIDCGNGVDGVFVKETLKGLGLEVIELFFKPDGNFPNHDPNPLKKESLDILKEKMKQNKAELGVAIDGDGDRIFFITKDEEIVPGDFITILIAEDFLEKDKNQTVLYDLRVSNIVPEKIKEFGGRPEMCRVGHSFIKEQMRDKNAVFAGELSGHFYYKDAFFTDSAIITLIKILNIISKKQKKLSELIKPYKKYFHSGEINSKVRDKEGKIKELERKYKNGKISHLDGIRVDFKDWWFNVRASNTEALLRLNLEAKSEKMMKEKVKEILKILTT